MGLVLYSIINNKNRAFINIIILKKDSKDNIAFLLKIVFFLA